MRTTVTIDDHLLAEAKAVAARTRRNLGDIIDDALRNHLTPSHRRDWDPVDIPTYGGSGLQPGIDLEDREGLAEVLGDNRPR
ncbi:MAG: DUF2191 domain-containing protein [Actinomycetota bacterium]|nr:DUF2191 domain-containing protein [Actinomycetota bacterium]